MELEEAGIIDELCICELEYFLLFLELLLLLLSLRSEIVFTYLIISNYIIVIIYKYESCLSDSRLQYGKYVTNYRKVTI